MLYLHLNKSYNSMEIIGWLLPGWNAADMLKTGCTMILHTHNLQQSVLLRGMGWRVKLRGDPAARLC